MKPHIEQFSGCWFVTSSRPPLSKFRTKLRRNVLLLGASNKSWREAWSNAASRFPFIARSVVSETARAAS